MRRAALALLLALTLPLGALAAEPPKLDGFADVPRRARLALFKAQQEKALGQAEDAVKVLRSFLRDNPGEDHYLLRFQLGALLLELERPDEARDAFREAAHLEPRHADSWLNMGELAYQAGDFAEAAEGIYQGYLLTPSQPQHLLYAAAAAYVMAEQPAKALPLLEDLVYRRTELAKLDWYRALIAACLDTDSRDEGERAVAHLLKQHGDDPEAWVLACQFHAAVSDYQRSAVDLTVAGYLRPLTEEEQVQLGNLYSAAGVPDLAGSCYAAALGDEPSAEDFERLASTYLAAHEREAALDTLERALAAEPSVRLWSLLGDLLYMEEEYGRARDAYAHCADMDAGQGRAVLMQGYCALEQDDEAGAVALLERAKGFEDQAQAAEQLLARLRSDTP